MNLVIVFFFSFFCLSNASDLLFENKDETILAMGGELSLVYYIDENIDPIFREAKITYSGKNFVCEVNHKEMALRQVCSQFRVVTHPAPALSCGCEIIQHQGVVPVCRMRRG